MMPEFIDVHNEPPPTSRRKKRHAKKNGSGITRSWIAIVLLAASVTAFTLVFVRGCFDGMVEQTNAGYAPRDIERQYNELQKMRENPDRVDRSAPCRQ